MLGTSGIEEKLKCHVRRKFQLNQDGGKNENSRRQRNSYKHTTGHVRLPKKGIYAKRDFAPKTQWEKCKLAVEGL